MPDIVETDCVYLFSTRQFGNNDLFGKVDPIISDELFDFYYQRNLYQEMTEQKWLDTVREYPEIDTVIKRTLNSYLETTPSDLVKIEYEDYINRYLKISDSRAALSAEKISKICFEGLTIGLASAFISNTVATEVTSAAVTSAIKSAFDYTDEINAVINAHIDIDRLVADVVPLSAALLVLRYGTLGTDIASQLKDAIIKKFKEDIMNNKGALQFWWEDTDNTDGTSLHCTEKDKKELLKYYYANIFKLYILTDETTGKEFYAVHHLLEPYQGFQKEWIQTLCSIIANVVKDSSNPRIRLILHDKDVPHGDGLDFNLIDSSISHNLDSSIEYLFAFQHTHNSITRFLTDNKPRNLAKELKSIINDYLWKEYLISVMENAPNLEKFSTQPPAVNMIFKDDKNPAVFFPDNAKEKLSAAGITINHPENFYQVTYLRELLPTDLMVLLRNTITSLY